MHILHLRRFAPAVRLGFGAALQAARGGLVAVPGAADGEEDDASITLRVRHALPALWRPAPCRLAGWLAGWLASLAVAASPPLAWWPPARLPARRPARARCYRHPPGRVATALLRRPPRLQACELLRRQKTRTYVEGDLKAALGLKLAKGHRTWRK